MNTNKEEVVKFKTIKKTCIITLNRPKSSNSFDMEVTKTISNKLETWKENNSFPEQIILKSEHPVIFSAGGDIIKLLTAKKVGASPEELAYSLKKQFELDNKFYDLKKKNIKTFSLLNGIVMGQGVGWTITNDYRIASENTMLAMPEARIGMFADNGVAYYFARLKSEVGRHMAVFGHRLRESQVFFSGIANCFVPSESFADLEKEIIDYGEQSKILQKGLAYKAEEIEELAAWVGYVSICEAIMDKVRGDVRGLTDVLHNLNSQLELNKNPLCYDGVDKYVGIISDKLQKGKEFRIGLIERNGFTGIELGNFRYAKKSYKNWIKFFESKFTFNDNFKPPCDCEIQGYIL
jgi:enoyl-CoA hydratase/carnithine racemase